MDDDEDSVLPGEGVEAFEDMFDDGSNLYFHVRVRPTEVERVRVVYGRFRIRLSSMLVISPHIMGRQRSQKAADTEALVKEALQGIKDGTYKSPYDAGKQLNINRRTILLFFCSNH